MGERPSASRTGLRRWLRDARRWIYGTAAAAGVWVLPKIPQPILRTFCRLAIAPFLRRRFSGLARRNLTAALGDRADGARIDEIVRQMADGMALLGAETAGCMAKGPDFFLDRIDDEEALRKLRTLEETWSGGFLGVTGHVGNWEIMAMWMQHRSRNGVGGVMAKRIGNRRLHQVVEGMRRKLGMESLYPDDPPSKAVHLLRAGKIIGILPDQDLKYHEGMFVDFMGRPAYTPLGPARLSWVGKVPILIGFCTRRKDGSFRIDIPAIFHPDRSRPKEEELPHLTRKWSRHMEEFILAHPEQWAWFHDRWNTTPEKLDSWGRPRLAFEGR